MNAERNMTIEEIRALCDQAITSMTEGAMEDYIRVDEVTLRCAEKLLSLHLQREVTRTDRTEPPKAALVVLRKVRDACFTPLLYVIQLVINLFGMLVLKVDHRFLDFRYPKYSPFPSTRLDSLGAPWTGIGSIERYGGIEKKDSPYLSMLRIMKGVPDTLEKLRKVIAADEDAARTFCEWLQDVGYRDEPFWSHLYFRLHTLGVACNYTPQDQTKMLECFKPDNDMIANSIKRALNCFFGDDRAVLREIEPLQPPKTPVRPSRKQKGGVVAFMESLISPPEIPGQQPPDDRDADW